MQADPLEEWRRLTTLYGEMGDLEIRELADQINDLTDRAQQILRDEIKKRGITTQPSASPELPFTKVSREAGSRAVAHGDQWQETATDSDDGQDSEETGRDYTWKTALCRCDSPDEAAARCEMLRRAGIDTWVQRPGSRFAIPWVDELGVGDIQINVAADQLEQARATVSQPIPQEILDQVREEGAAPGYDLPVCPKCHAEDPTLESVEPSNNWLCESCGYAWSDPAPAPSGSPQTEH